jgi:hypothetical protein
MCGRLIETMILFYDRYILVQSFDYYHVKKVLTSIKYADAHIVTYFNHKIVALCFHEDSLVRQNVQEVD